MKERTQKEIQQIFNPLSNDKKIHKYRFGQQIEINVMI